MTNIFKKADVTQDDVTEIVQSLELIKGLAPELRERLKSVTGLLSKENKPKPEAMAQVQEASDVNFLSDASTLICGKPLIQKESRALRTLGANLESLNQVDQRDYDELPSK